MRAPLALLCALSLALGLHSHSRHSLPLPPSEFHPLLSPSSHLNSSGVKLLLFPAGISYLNQIASNVLAHELPRLLIPNIEHRLPGDQGLITLSKVRISRFKRARHHNITTTRPNTFIWDLRDMDIGLIGDLSGQTKIVVPLDLSGEAEVLAEGLDFHLESMLERSGSGSASIRTISCSTTITSVQVINHNGGLFGLAVSVFKQGISDNVRNLLERLICQEIKKFIDDDLNRKLAEVQTRSSLKDALRVNGLGMKGGTKKSGFFGEDFGTTFFIDYRLHEAPSCGVNSVELGCAGEVSLMGKGETPFGAPPLPTPQAMSDEMLALSLSDFVPNSLFYHAYKHRRLRLSLDGGSADGLGKFLRTSCQDTVCIGDLLPQLADSHPNASLALYFAASRAPALLFSEKNGGVVSISLTGLIILYAEDGELKRQIALFDMDAIAEASLSIQRRNVHASIHLEKFELTKKFGEVQISKAELDDIAIIGSSLIENMLNEMLGNGFPLPVPHVVRLDEVELRVLNRRVVLRTKLSVDESRLSDIAAPLFPFVSHSDDTLSTFLDIAPPSLSLCSSGCSSLPPHPFFPRLFSV